MSINLYVHCTYTIYNSAHVLTLYLFFHKSVIAASYARARVYIYKKKKLCIIRYYKGHRGNAVAVVINRYINFDQKVMGCTCVFVTTTRLL